MRCSIGRMAGTVVIIGAVASLLMAAPARAAGEPQVLIDTVGAPEPNSLWTVDPRMTPQIGQSFILDRPVSATSVVLHPTEFSLAKKPEYLVAAYRHEHFNYFFDEGVLAANTSLNIWKSNDGSPLPVDPEPKKYGFDVAAGGFTNVYSRAYTVPFDLAKDFALPLEPAVTLEPGLYLVAWYFTFPDKRVFGIRFTGEVSGHSQGKWMGTQWLPTLCKYAPIPDTSPPGSAAYAADQWAPPGGLSPSGPFPGTIGYQTWFHPYDSKTISCLNPNIASYDKNGVALDKKGKPLKNPNFMKYMPYNTGDLDMQILGTPLPS